MASDRRWRMWRVTEPEPEYLGSRTRRDRGARHDAPGAPVRPERGGIVLRRWWNV